MIAQQLALQVLPSIDSTPPEKFILRDYQSKLVGDVYDLIRKGEKRILIYLPTGGGKTAIASQIVSDAVGKGRKVLFLVHRDALLPQTATALLKQGIPCGKIKAGYEEERHHPVQVASIQSLARRDFPENIDLVFVDEAHTVAFFRTFDRIKAQYPNAYFLGLTASPWRVKKKEYLGQHFDVLTLGPDVNKLIKQGYLAEPRHFGYGGMVDFSQIDTNSEGDFNEQQMQTAYMDQDVADNIVEHSLKFISDRAVILFCAGVEQSKQLTGLFNEKGIVTEHLDANTPLEERQAMYARLASGQTQMLSSVGTLTEGFDCPRVSTVILARATKSLALLFQMCGRGLRLYPNKEDCLLLDFGDNFKRLGFITTKRKITLHKNYEEKPAPMKECPDCHTLVYAFVMVCPKCGYEFPPAEKEDFALPFELTFGELLAPEDKAKMKYLRQQIRTKYAKREDMDRVWELYATRYRGEDGRGEYPPNEWHLGAIFGNKQSPSHHQEYLEYLTAIAINKPEKYKRNWVKFHFELEFGIPGKKYRIGDKSFEAPPSDLRRLAWWDVLKVSPLCTLEEVKLAYRKLAKLYHPDTAQTSDMLYNPATSSYFNPTEMMELLNWAYSTAKSIFS